MKDNIFNTVKLSGIKLNNRIIRSATHEGLADEKGFPTEKLIKKYIALAKGGVGAIITGYTGIRQDGKSSHHNMLMINTDEHIAAYKKLVDEVHSLKTPIILQAAHCGRLTRSKVTGMPTVAPSPVPDKMFKEDIPVELTEQGIEEIIDDFVKAVFRAKKAGFDGVQIHAAHGYLLSQFLSAYSNRRKDKWGGSIENRYRIISEIFKKIRQKDKKYPVFIKINGHDGRPGGMRMEEAVQFCKLIEKSECSGIEVSGGGGTEDGFFGTRSKKIPSKAIVKTSHNFEKMPGFIKSLITPLVSMMVPKAPEPLYNFNVPIAEEIKKNVKIPVIVVGGIRSIIDIREIIDNNKADFVSMCRPLIMEPSLVNKFKEGKQTEAKCIHCNYCTVAQFIYPLKCYHGKI